MPTAFEEVGNGHCQWLRKRMKMDQVFQAIEKRDNMLCWHE